MHLGHLYIFLSLASYSVLGILHKVAEVKDCRATAISLMMCSWSLVFLLATELVLGKNFEMPFHIAALALPFGICAGLAILTLQAALSFGNISTSWLAINLSAGIPTVLSIILYREAVNPWKLLALIAMGFSMVLLWKDSRSRKVHE